MNVGFIGLGRMGKNMVKRMLNSKKIDVFVWNRSPGPVEEVKALGANETSNIKDMINKLDEKNIAGEKKVIWLMLPAGDITESFFKDTLELLSPGDIIIDGANSNFHDTIRRHKEAKKKGILMLDVGVSGGIIAADQGYPMMVGGSKEAYDFCLPIFSSFGREKGYDLVGEEGGSGHYVKMIHNAIEYGMMQAISEGFDLLENGRFKDLDIHQISSMWNHGTVVSSFLMEMVENALKKDPKLKIKPYVSDSGEGKWAAIEAFEHNVPFTVNGYALNARYISRDDNSLAFRLLAAMRKEFGGHAVKE